MKKIVILSQFDFLLQIENKNYELDNKHFVEVENHKQNFSFLAYPIANTVSLPYTVRFEELNPKSTPYYEILSFSDRYEIKLKLFTLYSMVPIENYSCQIKNVRYLVKCFTDRICISCSSGEYVYEINQASCTFWTKGNLIYIMGENENVKILTLFNTENKTFCSQCGEEIEIDDTKIKCLNTPRNSLRCKILSTFNIDNLEKINDEFYKKENEIETKYPTFLVPYKFFDAIIIKDYKTAQKYLTPNLKNALSTKTLSSYFDGLVEVNLYKITPLIYTLYFNDKAADYKITIVKGLIDDIEDI